MRDEELRPIPAEDDEVEAAAAAWLAQRDAGFSSAQRREFEAWLEAERRNREAFARLERTWNTLQRLKEFRREAIASPARTVGDAERRPLRRLHPLPAMAATAAMAMLVWWFVSGREEVGATLVATASGEIEQVTLPDGSIADVNADSQLRVDYSPASRDVHLLRGEAHFSVVKDRARPFRVFAAGVSVRAVGTAFNVRIERDDVSVLVTEGRVEVEEETPPWTAVEEVAHETPRRVSVPVLEAGDRFTVRRPKDTSAAPAVVVERLEQAAIREALAWQESRFAFLDMPLGDLVARFNAENRVQVELVDPELAALPVGGSFRASNLEGFLRLLASDGEIVVDASDPDRIRLRANSSEQTRE
ncbi:FecR family protein [Opitutales bacterium ASA1]|uniref:FecR family protein n=1 Tax=Congregicoccus parvus TaxID=3081749 RepID=UPI002B2E4780|nr:FecR family protein [Opitutales bacterium ASA1]